MNFKLPVTLESTRNWYIRNYKSESRFDCSFETHDGTVVAMGGLTNIDHESKKAEFYMFVGPQFQAKGIGSYATYLLCRFAFDDLKLKKVYLYTNATNFGARRTYDKVGFKLEGTHRKELYKNGEWSDRLYFGVFCDELILPNKPKL